MKKIKSVIFVLLAGILWGCISIFINGLSDCGLSTMGIVSIRMLFGGILFAVFLLIKDRQLLKIAAKDIWMFLLTGIISVAIFNTFYSYTVIHSEASIGVVLLYTSPVFSIVLSAIFLKERLTVKKIIAAILVLAGCVMVSGILSASTSIPLLVFMTGIGSGLFWAAYTILSRIPMAKYSPLTCSAWSIFVAGIALLPFGIADNVPAKIVANPVIVLWGLGIAIFCTVLPYALYTAGLEGMESGKASILVSVELVTGALVGLVVFGEEFGLVKILGVFLCVAAILLLNLNFIKK